MIRNISFLFMLVLLTPALSSAQDKIPSANKNSVKINLVGKVLNNDSFLYERSMNEHWSLQPGAGFRWGGEIPRVFGMNPISIDPSPEMEAKFGFKYFRYGISFGVLF